MKSVKRNTRLTEWNESSACYVLKDGVEEVAALYALAAYEHEEECKVASKEVNNEMLSDEAIRLVNKLYTQEIHSIEQYNILMSALLNLKEYELDEEQNLLAHIPIKIGGEVYLPKDGKVFKCLVVGYSMGINGITMKVRSNFDINHYLCTAEHEYSIDGLGKRIFTSEAKAEVYLNSVAKKEDKMEELKRKVELLESLMKSYCENARSMEIKLELGEDFYDKVTRGLRDEIEQFKIKYKALQEE